VTIIATKGLFRRKTVQIVILSHYRGYQHGTSEIMHFIEKLGDSDTLVLASTTGWSDKAIEYAQKTPNDLILVDLKDKKVYYNPANLKLKEFIYYIRP